jgi:CheY-like chemotaxis protein
VSKALVFVVDDEEVISTTLAAILMKVGFEATPFTDPIEALESSQTRPPDILISDVVMPGMSGIELAIRIKATVPDCQVVLFSGQAETSDMLEDVGGQGHDFVLLTKPVHPSDLLAAITQTGMRRAALSL